MAVAILPLIPLPVVPAAIAVTKSTLNVTNPKNTMKRTIKTLLTDVEVEIQPHELMVILRFYFDAPTDAKFSVQGTLPTIKLTWQENERVDN